MSRSRPTTAALAALGAFVLIGISAAPGAAATPVAQGSASAVSLTIGGKSTDGGRYAVSNDGTTETASGSNRPALTALGGQSLIKTGTLAQDAVTTVRDGQGYVTACAGLAGQGATVVAAGDSDTCLTPGQTLSLNAGNLDLSGLTIASGPLLNGVDAQLQPLLQPILQPLTAALQTALTQAVTQLGLAVNLDLGAVQSSCTAGPGTADGTARLAGSGAYVEAGGQRVTLVDLPVAPPPNTHVVGNLGEVAAVIENAAQTQLTAVLGNLPGGLTLPVGVDQLSVLNAALDQVGQQLQPLQDNVIDIVLNKQTRTGSDQIEVTALDATLLPVAQQQLGVTAFNLKVGTSACGPTGKVAAPTATPTATSTPKPKGPPPAVPTRVPAGLESAPTPTANGSEGGWAGVLALSGLVLVTVGAVGAAARRSASGR